MRTVIVTAMIMVMVMAIMALRKMMQVTSLTGKQVSTDNSKVIGEEARARLKLKET